MRKLVAVVTLLLLSAATTSAAPTRQSWTAGWDNFSEPLNYAKSYVQWSVSSSRKLTITFNLVGASPTWLYQFSLNFFCTTFPANFGQFPTDGGGGTCTPLTRQGVTANSAEVEVAVVLTDLHGNGKAAITIGPVPSGTYDLEFFARNGAGCNVNSGGGNGASICEADFHDRCACYVGLRHRSCPRRCSLHLAGPRSKTREMVASAGDHSGHKNSC